MDTSITALTTFALADTLEIDRAALAVINEKIPEIIEKSKFFGRTNSQTTLALTSLLMLNGQSPHRMLRQVCAEVEKRRLSLSEAQVKHAELLKDYEQLANPQNDIDKAKQNHAATLLLDLSNRVNGAIKDIAVLVDAYSAIKKTFDINDWSEAAFEKEEGRHHVRRGFELLYRNLLETGAAQQATTEYLQQFGVHPQVAIAEVSGYIQHVAQEIANGTPPHANHLEDFLDAMRNKYESALPLTALRLFGRPHVSNTACMQSS